MEEQSGRLVEKSVFIEQLAQLPILARAWEYQAVSAGFAEMIRTSNYSWPSIFGWGAKCITTQSIQ
jgi:hypothetical protein